jgi:hypothetical protein
MKTIARSIPLLLALGLLAPACGSDEPASSAELVIWNAQETIEWSAQAYLVDDFGQVRIYLANDVNGCSHTWDESVQLVLPVLRGEEPEVLPVETTQIRGRFGYVELRDGERYMVDAMEGTIEPEEVEWTYDIDGSPRAVDTILGSLSVILRDGRRLEASFSAPSCR